MKKLYNLQDLIFLNRPGNKVGILGGTFNPAHFGHLMISKRALYNYKLTYIIWLVASQNPRKKKTKESIFERAKQALDIIDNPRILVSTAEYDMNTQQTYDSISGLIQHLPKVSFTWMMGKDNITHFSSWYNSKKILELCDMIIFDRNCKERYLNPEKFNLKPTTSLDNNNRKNIIIDNNDLYDISSTEIKKQ